MADFKTHFATAAVAGGGGATILLSVGVIGITQLFACFVAAIVGGLLPDIDSDNAPFLEVGFTLFSVIGSFFILQRLVNVLSIVELFLLWGGLFLFFKLLIFQLFIRFTTHRGIFHSVPAAFLSLFVLVIALDHGFSVSDEEAWIVGGFLFMGFIIHLLLDELYSLNLFGVGGTRHSLGTAFKFHSPSWIATGAVYGAGIAIYPFTPGSGGLFERLMGVEFRDAILQHLLPSGGWFSGVLPLL